MIKIRNPELCELGVLAGDKSGFGRESSRAKAQRTPRTENKKLEARNPKFETNSNGGKTQNSKHI
jgi:hypothetical protein